MAPRTIDYSNTCFYKICCKDLDITDIYVGHTTDFIRRKAYHKYRYNNEKDPSCNLYVYAFIREHGGFENFDMILIEKKSCNDRLEVLKKEREYVELLNATLNKHIPSRTLQEYKKDNIDKIRGRNREYYEINKDKIKDYALKNKDKLQEYRKDYNISNKEHIREQQWQYADTHKEQIKVKAKQYHENHKERIKVRCKQYHENNRERLKDQQKQYQEMHKDRIKEQRKQYYENNKEKIKGHEAQPITCSCGLEICMGWFSSPYEDHKT